MMRCKILLFALEASRNTDTGVPDSSDGYSIPYLNYTSDIDAGIYLGLYIMWPFGALRTCYKGSLAVQETSRLRAPN